MWSDLSRACQSSGLAVIEEPDWQYIGHGVTNYPRTVGLHHTAGPTTGDCPSLNTVKYGRTDLPGPLANLFLCRSGTVHVVAAGMAYHAGAVLSPDYANQNCIGIEAEATGVDPWPDTQYNAFLALCRSLTQWYGLGTPNNLGHKEICSPPGRKIDPNFEMPIFRTDMSVQQTRKVLPTMIEREITQGKGQYKRIACTVGRASALVSKAYMSITCKDGFYCRAAFQMSSDTDGAPPGAGPMWEVRGNNGKRQWLELPNGTEYIELWIDADGPGSVLIEMVPK